MDLHTDSHAKPREARRETPLTALIWVFMAAGVLRNAYSLFVHADLGAAGLMGPDSRAFMLAAEYLAAGGSIFDVAPGIPGFPVDMMPVAFWLMALFAEPSFTGDGNPMSSPLGFVLFQGWIDAGTCVFAGLLAARFGRKVFLAVCVLVVLNPTQIVVSGLYYTDTVFLFFATGALTVLASWLSRGGAETALAAGVFLGLALMTRPFLQYWLFILPVIMVGLRWLADREARFVFMVRDTAIVALTVLIIASPIMTRNHTAFGTVALHSQTGSHLLNWIVPTAREAKDGTPRSKSLARNQALYDDRFASGTNNPFEHSARLTALAREELREIGWGNLAVTWATGMGLNLVTPAVTIAPTVSRVPRVGYVDSPGESTIEKIWSFLFQNNSNYTIIILAAALPIPFLIGAALIGAGSIILRGPTGLKAVLILLSLWAGYTLFLAGPVFSPKYRLPLETSWAILAGVGAVHLRDFARAVLGK